MFDRDRFVGGSVLEYEFVAARRESQFDVVVGYFDEENIFNMEVLMAEVKVLLCVFKSVAENCKYCFDVVPFHGPEALLKSSVCFGEHADASSVNVSAEIMPWDDKVAHNGIIGKCFMHKMFGEELVGADFRGAQNFVVPCNNAKFVDGVFEATSVFCDIVKKIFARPKHGQESPVIVLKSEDALARPRAHVHFSDPAVFKFVNERRFALADAFALLAKINRVPFRSLSEFPRLEQL